MVSTGLRVVAMNNAVVVGHSHTKLNEELATTTAIATTIAVTSISLRIAFLYSFSTGN